MKYLSTLVLFALLAMNANAQTDIADARTYAQGATVTITGIVTNGDEFGPIRYVEDSSGGLPFYTPSVGETMAPGDNVTITGEMGEFMGLIQVTNVSASSINSSGNPLPGPQDVTPNDLGADTEAEVVRINNVTFEDGGGQFTGNTTFNFTSNGETSQVFVRSGNPLVGTDIPDVPVNITGIVSQFNGDYQLLMRGASDIDGNFVQDVTQENITTTSFDVNWTSNFMSDTKISYGLTEDLELGTMDLGGLSLDHSATLSGLDPATFYWVQVTSEGANGAMASSPKRVYTTQSESSGEFQVYFNNSVDVSVADGTEAEFLLAGDIEDKLIEFIDNADSTIDCAIYNINRVRLVQALNSAVARGVAVRYIANNGTLNSALDQGMPTFPNISVNGGALMHNKIFIFDGASTDNSWVMSGSMNMTAQNIVDDFNNVVFIQDEALAKAYTWEFNEMWGSETDTPIIFNILVGDQKRNNTPHLFNINGIYVESYFSPSDNTTNAITNAMGTADDNIDFAVLTFTMNDIRDALFDADDRGVELRGLIENTSDIGSDFDVLSAAFNITDHPASGSIHHKYAIIDAMSPSSDPQVITGSHNWSASAESSNDENTLIIHNATIANLYLQEFTARWLGQIANIETVTFIPGIDLNVYPNPAVDYTFLEIDSENGFDATVQVWTSNGKIVKEQKMKIASGNNKEEIELSNLSSGSYFISIQIEDKALVRPLKVVR